MAKSLAQSIHEKSGGPALRANPILLADALHFDCVGHQADDPVCGMPDPSDEGVDADKGAITSIVAASR
jgi:hypothetical protein